MGQIHTFFMDTLNVEAAMAAWLTTLTALIFVVLIGVVIDNIARRLISAALRKLALRTAFTWDDALVKHKVFSRLANFAPALVIYMAAAIVFPEPGSAREIMQDGAFLVMIVLAILLVYALINSLLEMYDGLRVSREVPLKGFAQVIKIFVFLAAAIFSISLLTDKSPVVLVSGIGAMTAVLMLIFKDAILGFVAGIQLIGNRMVARGDWIEMPSQGADGDVIDVSLTTVKVQNWDKTISTIPTYALISSSFKNWRGMSESGGRRIKRAFNIDMNTIRFCDEEMLQRFARIQYIQAYLDQKASDISKFNTDHQVDAASRVNGRRLTNVGTLRAYIVAYLKHHPMISDSMTFLVRQLARTEHGLPIEIYVFSTDKVWAHYEDIQADIFDHILAVIPEFDLRVFQQPSGHDFQALGRAPA